jgi:hypothetical protein
MLLCFDIPSSAFRLFPVPSKKKENQMTCLHVMAGVLFDSVDFTEDDSPCSGEVFTAASDIEAGI